MIISLIVAVGFAYSCAVLFLIKNNKIKIYNPIALQYFGFVLPFLLSPLIKFTPYYEDWEPDLILFITIYSATFAFHLGLFFSKFVVFSNPRKITKAENFKKIDEIVEFKYVNKMGNFLIFPAFIGFANNILNIYNSGGFTVYIDHGLREAEIIFGSNTIINYLYFLNILCFIVFGFLAINNKYKIKYVNVKFIYSIIALLSHGVKSTILWPSVMLLIYLLINDWSIKIKNIVIGLIFIMAVFLIVTLVRDLPWIINAQGNIYDVDIFDFLTKGLLNIPLYLSSGFVNFGVELNKFRDYAYGLNVGAPFLDVYNFLFGQRQVNEATFASEIYLYYDAYNTATYLRDLYRDFTFVGVIIFSFIYGSIASFLYILSFKKNNHHLKIIYSIFSAAIVAMFFSNHFQKIQYIYLSLVVAIFYLVARAKPLKPAWTCP